MKQLRNIFRLLRPRQWMKNFAVFPALLFSGELFNFTLFEKVSFGFIIFCLVSSAIYVINDIFDVEKDKLHPFKRNRPLANGDVSIPTAWGIAFILIAVSLYSSFLLSPDLLYGIPVPIFLLIMLIYLFLQIAYSMLLKNIAIIDILALAAGYILRVYAGETLSGYHISVWLLLSTISLSLFLAIGKRRRELTLVSGETSKHISEIRKSLSHYSERLLDVYASIFATSTFISYALFTFIENSSNLSVTNDLFLPDYLPGAFQRKWLMLTIFPVVYGLMRYLQDIYEKHEGESPERVLLSDKPLMATVLLWAGLVILIIYGFR